MAKKKIIHVYVTCNRREYSKVAILQTSMK